MELFVAHIEKATISPCTQKTCVQLNGNGSSKSVLKKTLEYMGNEFWLYLWPSITALIRNLLFQDSYSNGLQICKVLFNAPYYVWAEQYIIHGNGRAMLLGLAMVEWRKYLVTHHCFLLNTYSSYMHNTTGSNEFVAPKLFRNLPRVGGSIRRALGTHISWAVRTA